MLFAFLILSVTLFGSSLARFRRFNKMEFDKFIDNENFVVVLICSSVTERLCSKELEKMSILYDQMSEHEDLMFTFADNETDAIFISRCNVERFPSVKLFPYEEPPQSYLLNIRIPDLKKKILDIKSEHSEKEADESPPPARDPRNKKVPLIETDWIDVATTVGGPEMHTMLLLYEEDCSDICRVLERVFGVYHREPELKFYKLSRDEAGPLRDRLPFPKDPTAIFFPKDNKEGIIYEGNETVGDLVDFINAKASLARNYDGSLRPDAGRIQEIDKLLSDNILQILLKKDISYIIFLVQNMEKDYPLQKKYIKYYIGVLKEIKKSKNPDQVLIREQDFLVKRISQIWSESSEYDELTKYLNIISIFVDSAATKIYEDEAKKEEKKKLIAQSQKKPKTTITRNFGISSQGQLKKDHNFKRGRRSVFLRDEL